MKAVSDAATPTLDVDSYVSLVVEMMESAAAEGKTYISDPFGDLLDFPTSAQIAEVYKLLRLNGYKVLLHEDQVSDDRINSEYTIISW